MDKVTFDTLKNNERIKEYIEAGNEALGVLGFTEHSFPHIFKTAFTAAEILTDLGYSKEEAELARIAGLMHDIGNMVNRHNHALSGAIIAESILHEQGMDCKSAAKIVCAIGNHDEETGKPVNITAAALILADKSDVRRTRVREKDMAKILNDIHDRVNYAVEKSQIKVQSQAGKKLTVLELKIDTAVCQVIDYFEIFLTRMNMCRRAASFLGAEFELIINDLRIM